MGGTGRNSRCSRQPYLGITHPGKKGGNHVNHWGGEENDKKKIRIKWITNPVLKNAGVSNLPKAIREAEQKRPKKKKDRHLGKKPPLTLPQWVTRNTQGCFERGRKIGVRTKRNAHSQHCPVSCFNHLGP